jgi:hypothetical protein
MQKHLTFASLGLLVSLITGCDEPTTEPEPAPATAPNATAAECDQLGEKFFELSVIEGKTQALSDDEVKMAAAEKQAEVVEICKEQPPLRAQIDCALQATTFEVLAKC